MKVGTNLVLYVVYGLSLYSSATGAEGMASGAAGGGGVRPNSPPHNARVGKIGSLFWGVVRTAVIPFRGAFDN